MIQPIRILSSPPKLASRFHLSVRPTSIASMSNESLSYGFEKDSGDHKSQSNGEHHRYDVIIIGAGLSGLSAARSLVARGRTNLAILEASDRVGGRTLDFVTPAGSVLEMGGQWIGPGQTEIIKLAEALKIDMFETYNGGETIYRYGRRTTRFTGDTPPCSIMAKVDLYRARSKINALAKATNAQEPWKSKNARALDGRSIGSWIEDNLWTREAKQILRLALRAVYGEDVDMISFLDMLCAVAAVGGNLDQLLDDAQSTRFVQGPMSLSEGILAELPRGLVKFDEKVLNISTRDGLATITTLSGGTFEANHIVLTLPRPLLGEINFSPPLPSSTVQFLQRQPMGSVIKVNIVYSTPFWRSKGLSGACILPDEDSPFQVTYDNSPTDGREGVLMGLMAGEASRTFAEHTPEERRSEIVDFLTSLFGEQASTPSGYYEKVWAEDPFARGAYGSFNPPGVMTAFREASQSRPYRNIHFAGDATSEVWSGYMEGAIRSGQRCADEISAAFL